MNKVSKAKSWMVASLALAATLGTAASPAMAGAKLNFGVGINLAARVAWGSFGDARNSADSNTSVAISIGGAKGSLWANVHIQDSAGTNAYCYTSEPSIVQALQSANSDGYVYVTWDASGQCNYVGVYNASAYAVKLP